MDAEFAERLNQVLRDHGVPTFFSPANVVGAQQWQDEILGALKRCDWFIVLLSPNAIDSMWVKRETAFAMKERRYENQIVPLLDRDCDLGPLEWLTIFQSVDFRKVFEDGCRDLLRVWGIAFKG